jgi:ribosomal protein L7Ae-like RNA K-turn-binding protein
MDNATLPPIRVIHDQIDQTLASVRQGETNVPVVVTATSQEIGNFCHICLAI